MITEITEFVMNHPLFSHHDHHNDFKVFEEERKKLDFRDMLGYAKAELETAAGPRAVGIPEKGAESESWVRANWPSLRTTGSGRAVDMASRDLFGLEYTLENFEAILEAMQSAFDGKSATEVYNYFVIERVNNHWVLQDGCYRAGTEHLIGVERYPDYYRFAWRMDDLLSIYDDAPIKSLEEATGKSILSIDDLNDAANKTIDIFKASGELAAIKIGIAYRRVRFDIFHASWPWTSEVGAIAKNYPNVYLDMCWACAMNPTESGRALSEWLDGVPYNKIFGYGADTRWPWCNVGYSPQARKGIARVLEQKIAAGYFSLSTAKDVAAAIMLENGERFFRLSS